MRETSPYTKALRRWCRFVATGLKGPLLKLSANLSGTFAVEAEGQYLTLLFYHAEVTVLAGDVPGDIYYSITFSDIHTTEWNDSTEVKMWGHSKPQDFAATILDRLDERNGDTVRTLLFNARNILNDTRLQPYRAAGLSSTPR